MTEVRDRTQQKASTRHGPDGFPIPNVTSVKVTLLVIQQAFFWSDGGGAGEGQQHPDFYRQPYDQPPQHPLVHLMFWVRYHLGGFQRPKGCCAYTSCG